MNRVYCNFITPAIREQAHRLGINPSILNNIISTMKSVNNNPNIDTSDDAITTFINNNKDRMKELKLSLPYYKGIPLSTNYNKLTSTIMGNITIRTFNDNFFSIFTNILIQFNRISRFHHIVLNFPIMF